MPASCGLTSKARQGNNSTSLLASHGSTMHFSKDADLQPVALQALAEPSNVLQASAEPSCVGNVTHVITTSKPKPIFRLSNQCTPNATLNYSNDVVQKQKEIITSIWPDTTRQAFEQFPEFCALYNNIKRCGLPNFLGAKIPICSALNLNAWRLKLAQYHDKEICTFLEFGWPVGYHSITPPSSAEVNHPSATCHPTHISKFLETELSHGAMVGPFKAPPFKPWTRCSPLMTRPKKDTTERRVIIDLSFPHGEAVNDGINTVNFFGKDISYSLPTIGDLIARIQQQGRGAFLWKADLARAYRQLRIDPLDTPLLAIKFQDKYYLDLCPSFGCRTSSAACQRVSNALAFIMANEGHTILAYLDDYASCHAHLDSAQEGFKKFISTTKELGLDLAIHKCVSPTNVIDWLGYTIDSNEMLVSIPKAKLQDFVKECNTWISKRRASKRAIQSLVGRMAFISNCVTQGRKFMSRALASLRAMGDRDWTTLSDQFRLDIKWFICYANIGNGVSLITPSRYEAHIECDSSLSGGGGVAQAFCYTWKYTRAHVSTYNNIHELEAINTVVAFRTLAPKIASQGYKVIISTDNSSSAFALETGRTKDNTLAACSRELWLLAATSDQVIEIRHKPGVLIPLSDALSRMHEDQTKSDYALARIRHESLCLIMPVTNDYQFFNSAL